jgi:hypothetical protein
MLGDVTVLLALLEAGSMKGIFIIVFERIVRINIFRFWPPGNIRQAHSKKDRLHIMKKFEISASYNLNLTLFHVEHFEWSTLVYTSHMQDVPSFTVSKKNPVFISFTNCVPYDLRILFILIKGTWVTLN